MIVKFDDLKKIRKENLNKTIVVAIGTFDLFHFEHLNYLKDAKKLGDVLLVVVKGNFLAKKKHPTRPIVDEKERIQIIDELKCVDYTILCDEKIFEDSQKNCNFSFDEENNNWLYSFFEILKNLQPNILYHENTTHIQEAREFVSKKLGITLISRTRTAKVTTSKLIEKIKNN